MTERQNIEWKQSWHDDYLKWICGFANAIGGVIYIGKDDAGRVVGLSDYQALMESIPQKIRNAMGIICDINLLEENDLHYIEIKVNPYSVPVSLRGRYYYRSGSTKMELTGVELNEFLLKKAGKTWDDVIEEGATIADIDEESIAKFVLASKGMGRLPDTEGLSTIQILEKLQLTEGNKLKRGAIVLFGKNPSRFFPNLEVRIGRFGVDAADLRFQEVVEGNLVQILDQVPIQLNHKFLIRPISFEGMHRVKKDSYPKAAIREMLLNALVHRAYMGAHVQLRVHDDRLTIWNEGALPQGLTLDDLKKEHQSRPRNPKIAKVCFMAGYIDTWGRGTLKILDACEKAGLPEPDIKETNSGIAVTLYMRKDEITSVEVRDDFGMISERIRKEFGSIAGRIESEPSKNKAFLQSHYQSLSHCLEENFGITSGKLRKSFGKASGKKLPNPINTLFIIAIFPEATAIQIGKILGVSDRSVETYIQKLKSEGMIDREGGKKDGSWQIKFLK